MLIIGCYPSWAIYKDYKIDDIPPNTISHLTYCFASIKDGLLVLGDPWADLKVQNQWPDDNDLINGNFKDLLNFKERNRQVKIGIAIGGWGCEFTSAVCTEESRMAFAMRVGQLLDRYNFEYIDIDWEYPMTGGEHENLFSLVQLVKANVQCDVFLSLPCNLNMLAEYRLAELAMHVQYFSLMGYELSGEWNDKTAYSSNLFASNTCPLSVDAAIQFILRKGIPANKIILGIPFYGKQFGNCQEIGSPFRGVRDIDYRSIDPGEIHFDSSLIASRSKASGSLTVFDCQKCVAGKAKYAKSLGLAGLMCWDLSKDTIDVDSRLLKALADAM